MLNHVRSWLYVGDESRPFVVLDGLPGLYWLKYDIATTCRLPLYLCSYKLDGSAIAIRSSRKHSLISVPSGWICRLLSRSTTPSTGPCTLMGPSTSMVLGQAYISSRHQGISFATSFAYTSQHPIIPLNTKCRRNMVGSPPRGMPKVVDCRQTDAQATNKMVMKDTRGFIQVRLPRRRNTYVLRLIVLLYVNERCFLEGSPARLI